MASSIVFDNAILLSHNVFKKGYGCKLNDNIESEWYIEDLVSDFKGVLLSANKLKLMV